MPLTASSTLAHRARCVQAASLGRPAVVAHYNRQQTRGFRFGKLWSKYLDADFHRDVYRRHQHLRQQYIEALNRQLSWEKHPLSQRPWRTDYPKSCISGRWASTDANNTTPDNPDGVRPGQNIEDVERAPLEQLLFGSRDGRPKNKPLKHSSHKPASPEYTIDPITNRKVFKSSAPANDLHDLHDILSPLHSMSDSGLDFNTYKSQFSPLRPPPVDNTQAPIFYDGPPPEAELKLYSQIKIDEEPWDTPSPPLQGQAKPSLAKAEDLAPTLFDAIKSEHKDVTWQGTNVIGSTLTNDAPAYSDLHKYRVAAEPDPAVPTAPADVKLYSDLDQYVPTKDHPLDQLLAQHKTEIRKDTEKYGAIMVDEPDGKYKVEQEKVDNQQELGKYDAVRSYEPDGKYKVDSETVLNQQELGKYEAVRAHEPDGKYAVEHTNPNPDPVEWVEWAEYSKPFLSHEPDGKYAEAYIEPAPDAVELARYKTGFRSHEPDGKYATNHESTPYDSSELKTYCAFRSHEPDGIYAASTVELPADAAELDTYTPFKAHEPDGKYVAQSVVRSDDAAELDQYDKPFGGDEPNGKYAAQGESTAESSDLGYHEAFTMDDSEAMARAQGKQVVEDMPVLDEYDPARHNKAGDSVVEMIDTAELGKYKAVRWNEPDGQPTNHPPFEAQLEGSAVEDKTDFQQMVENLMASTANEASPSTKDSGESSSNSSDGKGVASGMRKRRLTGQYVQDFPEDFAVSWSAEPSATKSSLLPTDLGNSTGASASEPRSEARRTWFRATEDDVAAGSPKSTVYKILVYDPVMQSIDVAETSSVVSDTAAPLTPADVLLRISNPSKFFPHFAPLQAQGFEIVSGSGDVLIFRKVRDALDDKSPAHVAPTETVSAATTTPVNPIDMTGGNRLGEYNVAASRFASPTGFVNYEWPPDRSNTYIHRGEPLAEQPTTGEAYSEVKDGKKKSLARRLFVGAATLAGISYSVGVVGDQLKAGAKEVKPVAQKT